MTSNAQTANPIAPTVTDTSPDTQTFFGFFSSSSAAPGVGTSNLNGDSVAWPGPGASVALDAGANATITGPGTWANGSLTVQRSGTAISSDVLDFNGSGAAFTVNGNDLQAGGQTIGSFTNSGGILTISFTANATSALVEDVIHRVTYRSDTPAGDATLRLGLTYGSTTANADVTVSSNQIYVTNVTDTATVDLSDGVSLSEALAIAATAGGNKTIVFASSLAGSTINLAANATVAAGTTFEIAGNGTVTIADNKLTFTDQFKVSAGSGARLIVKSEVNGNIEKTGSGTLELDRGPDGSNNTTGTILVSGGELAVKGNNNTISDTSAVTVDSGAQLTLAQGAETIGSLAGAGNVSLGYRLTLGGDNTSTTFSGTISSTNTSGIQKEGLGTFTLSGANTYTGTTMVNGGTLALSGGSAIGDASAVTVNASGTLDLSAASETLASLAGAGNAALGNKTLTVGASNTSTSFAGQLSGSGTLAKTGTGTLALSGNNNSATFSGSTVIAGGALSVGSDGNLGSNALSLGAGTRLILTGGNIDNAVVLSGNATISATAAAILSGSISGPGYNLLKTGPGALTLTNSATFNDVTVGDGALVLGNAGLTGNSVTVNSGATLAGTGTVNGPLTVASGGTLAPGDTATGAGVGKLRVLGDLAINAGGKLAVDINGTTPITQYDLLEAEGGVSIAGSTLAVTLGYAPQVGDIYAILDAFNSGTAITGNFNALVEAGTTTVNATVFKASYTGGTDHNDFTLTVPAPAPAPAPDPAPSAPPSPTVDGVPVTTTAGANGANIITVQVVQATRPETAGTPHPTLADIPLVKDSTGQPLLQAGIPTGMGLQAEGLPTSTTGAAALAELNLRIERAGAGTELGPQAQAFLANLAPNEPLVVQTITPTVGAGFDHNVPLVITGSTAAGAGKQAIIIDARGLPSGTVIQVDNIEFIAVVGNVRLVGGAGQNAASGDGGAQWIVLGPDDDIIHGGGGNDTVGSEGGDDQVYGDAGDDIVFGGAGNDLLSGGTGSDRLNGGTGFDVAIQEGKRTDYTVTLDGAGIKLTHIASGVSDWLVDVEQVRFATGPSLTVAHSAAEEAAAFLFQKWIGRDLSQAEGAVIQTLTGQSALEVATLFAQVFPQQSAGKTPAQLLEGMSAAGTVRVDAVREVTVTGDAGHNTITPTLGLARYVDGGAGIDTVVIPATLAQTHLKANGSGNFTLQRMTDGAMLDLTSVERINLSDTKLALDLNGHAGEAARLLGALGGPAILANKGLVGEVIRALDAGVSSQALAGIGLQALGAQTPAQVAQLLWTNVVGRAGTAQELQPLVDLMGQGITASDLAVMAGNLDLNATRIDLVGLTAKGLEFA